MAYNSTLSSQNIESALRTVHEAITIGGGILSLTSESGSSAISDVVGGTSGFNDLLTKARAKNVSFGITVDESSTAGITMASILADKTESKLTISFVYNRAFIKDVITLSDSTFTLEQTVLPLTGNITYHTHDTTYAAQELETDVWDGTTVSTSWSGSGTEEDPFLIQSCADYIYFLEGEIPSLANRDDIASSTTKFVKITKNLDFGNKSIPTVTINESASNINNYTRANVVVDGNGCIVKNISLDFQSNPIVGGSDGNITYPLYYIPYGMAIFVHDVNFVGVNLKFGYDPSEHLQTVLFYNLLANIVLEMNVEITGSYDEAVRFIITNNYISWPEVGFSSIGSVSKYNNYISEKGCFFGIDIKIQNIPTAGIATILSNSGPFIGYDMSNYTFSGDMENTKGEYVLSLIGNTTPSSFKLSTLSTGKYVHQELNGSASVIDAETISPEDLKSQSYINEINSSNPVLTLNPNHNLPLIASLQVSYNGYVKKSVFDALGVKVDDINKKILAFLEITGISNLNESSSSETISEFISWYDNEISNLNISRHKVLHYVVEDSGLIPVSVTGDGPDYNFTWVNKGVHVYKHIFRGASTFTITVKENDLIDREEVLVKDNTLAYTPTADYHPATKKYVDDSLPKTDFVSLTVTKLAGDSLKFRGFYENEPVDIELSCTHTEESSESPYIFEHYEVEITESTNSTLFKILSTVSRLYASRYNFPDSPAKSIQTRIKPEVFLDNYYTAYPVEGMLFGIESAHSPGFYAFVGGATSSTGVEIKIIGMTMALNGNKITLKYFPNVKWNFG